MWGIRGDVSEVYRVEQGLGSEFCCSTAGVRGFKRDATDKMLLMVVENVCQAAWERELILRQ